MPSEKDNILEFNQYIKLDKMPYIIYADISSLIKYAKVCYICGKRTLKKFSKSINYWKVRNHCRNAGKYRGATHNICTLKFSVPNKIPVVFLNSSNYDYHFTIKELSNEFERQFECLGENTEKYKTCSVPIEKKLKKIDKDGNESVAAISYKIKLTDSERFMANLLSNLVDNLAEGIHKIKWKDCDCFLEHESVKNHLIKYEYKSFNKDYLNKLDKKIKKKTI